MSGQHKASAGFLPDERIGALPPPIEPEVLERFRRLSDLSGTLSDVLDKMGLRGVVGASRLRPTIADARIIGRAITVRNTVQRLDPYAAIAQDDNRMCEVEGLHQAGPGDVLVIQGVREVSNMGGIMAHVARRQGVVGAVVDGAVRDVGYSRGLGFPIWSSDISPVTGKFRCITQEINRTVQVGGVTVHPGDLVVADETGVCFLPQALIEQVLPLCEEGDRVEESWLRELEAGLSIPDLVRKLYKRFPYSEA